MGRLLNFLLDRGSRHNSAAYPDMADLFEGLKREENEAIRVLYSRISAPLFKMGKTYGLSEEDVEELIGDCIALLLLKIRTEQYVFQGYDPATYAIEIAKNKVRHFKKRNTAELMEVANIAVEPEYTSWESVEMLEKLLSQLPPNCQNLIRLKYLDEMRDKDIIEQKLTQYTTVDALKNHRAQCMKSLIALGAAFL